VHVTPLPNAEAVLDLDDRWIEDYNDNHPHSGLKRRSPRDFIAAQTATVRVSGETPARSSCRQRDAAAQSTGGNMTVRFEQILAGGVAECSYLLGDDSADTAAVVDPVPDVEVYLETARRLGLAITHVVETHIHADFMSGARELVARLGGTPRLCVSVEAGAEYDFVHEAVRDGDSFAFGGVRMVARHTPRHTPEHVSYLLYEGETEEPWAS
jgi:hypothetical protein